LLPCGGALYCEAELDNVDDGPCCIGSATGRGHVTGDLRLVNAPVRVMPEPEDMSTGARNTHLDPNVMEPFPRDMLLAPYKPFPDGRTPEFLRNIPRS
jgi:hypothetical protein